VDGHFVTESQNISDDFVNHFKSIFNTSSPTITAPQSLTTDFLPMAPISASVVSKTTKRLKPSKHVALDGSPSFIIKGCSDIFSPLLTYIFNLNVASETFPSLYQYSRKQQYNGQQLVYWPMFFF
jgi:hypothetical protein